MNQKNRVLLSRVTEAVLVLSGDLELENYDHWDYLIDACVELHEALNDMKPSTGAIEE